jgi:hypothetical protein
VISPGRPKLHPTKNRQKFHAFFSNSSYTVPFIPAPPLRHSTSPVVSSLRTPATIVMCTCASWHSPGLLHLPYYLPYICHSPWFFPQALLILFLFNVCTLFVFLVLYYVLFIITFALTVLASRLPVFTLHTLKLHTLKHYHNFHNFTVFIQPCFMEICIKHMKIKSLTALGL